MDAMNVKTLVLPVAGMGTRLMPLTLNRPKALVGVCGKPLLEYMIEDGWASGLREIVLVASPQHLQDFETYLEGAKKRFSGLVAHLRIQEQAFGNGRALLEAKDIIGKVPFAVRFCDDLVFGKENSLAGLLRVHREKQASVILLERVPEQDAHRYGVVGLRNPEGGPVYAITHIVEKPKQEEGKPHMLPSNLAVVGAYILTPSILKHLEDALPDAPEATDGLPLTVGFERELASESPIFGLELSGTRFDCGVLEGIQKAEEFLCEGKVARDK